MDQLGFVIPGLMGSAAWEQDLICRVLGDCVHGAQLDSEIGALDTPDEAGLLSWNEKKFTYARYDQITKVRDQEAVDLYQKEFELDDISLIPILRKTGEKYAEKHVRLEHLYPRRTGQ
jgi:hypothetical protein